MGVPPLGLDTLCGTCAPRGRVRRKDGNLQNKCSEQTVMQSLDRTFSRAIEDLSIANQGNHMATHQLMQERAGTAVTSWGRLKNAPSSKEVHGRGGDVREVCGWPG